MGKVKDISGQQFGRLTVIRRAEYNVRNKTAWICKCSCGNEKIILRDNLVRGKTKSCGCLRSEFTGRKAEDLLDKKFGRLTVIERVSDCKKGGVQWLCLCDCGNEKIVLSKQLKSGETQSCGCIVKELGRQRINIMREKALNVGRFKGTKIGNISSQNIYKNNTSGAKGVSWSKDRGKWHAYIDLKGMRKNLGFFDDLDMAILVRKQAEKEYFLPIIEEYNILR